MSSRRYAESDYTYDDRRERDYVSRAGSRYDDRYEDREIEFRRSAPPVRERERDREEIEIREDRTRARDPPAFLRDDYGRTSAGPVVLRAREKEEFDFIPRSRRRSPSPESDRKTERDSIIIRRDREETESRPPPRRERERETERSVDREEIIIRRDDRERSRAAPAPPPPPPPPPPEDIEREEIIIRRSERSRSRPPPARDEGETERIVIRRRDDDRASRYEAPPPPREVDREEIIIRRRNEDDRASRYEAPPPPREFDQEIIIRRRDEDDRASRYEAPPPPPPPPPKEVDREEIIIRRNRDEDTKSVASARSRRDIDYAVVRPKSRERERHDSSDSEHEVIIRRDEIKGRGRENTRSREEIIIRSKSHSSSRSPSPAPSVRSARSARSTRSSRPPAPAPEPQIVYAPQIHQEVITHHRHVDHGYELAIPQRSRPVSRPVSRPPSPPSPPPPEPSPPPPPPPAREQSEERIEIRRSESRNGRTSYEDITIDRTEGARSVPPPERREPRYRDDRDFEEEAEYYNQRALERSYPGEGWHGATRDWALIDVPPGTRRVRMDGAGGGAQEITWQRYNGMRRSKFYADADDDEVYSNYEVDRPAAPPAPLPRPEPLPATGGDIGRRYGKTKDPKAGLWTEITKDLVVKEAITEMGYEYEETEEFYYIIAYLKYEDVARLVGLSEDIRNDRRKRVQELEWETKIKPEPLSPRRPLAIEPPPPIRSPRSSVYEREDERYIEREYYRGPPRRPPPPPGWRR